MRRDATVDRDLAALQQRFQEAVMAPRDDGDVDPRISIYREMYRLRIVDALAQDSPSLRRALGPQRFEEFCVAYIAAHPSRSFTLEAIDGALEAFLESWDGIDPRERPRLREKLGLDRVAKELLTGDDEPPLDALQLRAIDKAAWERARLVPVASLRIVPLRHGRRPVDVAVWRAGPGIVRRALAPPAAAFLRDLAAGVPLAEATMRAAVPPLRAAEHVSRWLRRFFASGLFARVTV